MVTLAQDAADLLNIDVKQQINTLSLALFVLSESDYT